MIKNNKSNQTNKNSSKDAEVRSDKRDKPNINVNIVILSNDDEYNEEIVIKNKNNDKSTNNDNNINNINKSASGNKDNNNNIQIVEKMETLEEKEGQEEVQEAIELQYNMYEKKLHDEKSNLIILLIPIQF